MTRVALNPRDLTALIPDGPVNRHTPVILEVDLDSGQVFGVWDLEVSRAQARGPGGSLPPEQLVGGPAADADELERLRQEIRELRAEREQTQTGAGSSPAHTEGA